MGAGLLLLIASGTAEKIGGYAAALVIRDQDDPSLSALAQCFDQNKELFERGGYTYCPRRNIKMLVTPMNPDFKLSQR
jgi:hypothetical protein